MRTPTPPALQPHDSSQLSLSRVPVRMNYIMQTIDLVPCPRALWTWLLVHTIDKDYRLTQAPRRRVSSCVLCCLRVVYWTRSRIRPQIKPQKPRPHPPPHNEAQCRCAHMHRARLWLLRVETLERPQRPCIPPTMSSFAYPSSHLAPVCFSHPHIPLAPPHTRRLTHPTATRRK